MFSDTFKGLPVLCDRVLMLLAYTCLEVNRPMSLNMYFTQSHAVMLHGTWYLFIVWFDCELINARGFYLLLNIGGHIDPILI